MSRLHTQRGFTMPMVLGVLLVATLLGTAALAAARGGTAASGESRDDKQAYAAAEAGVNWYLSRLIFDNAFWAKCTDTAGPEAPVNNPWNGSGADPRRWREIPDPDDSSNAEYTVELLPANGKTACSSTDANNTMIEAGTGTFRIRATGRFNGNKRSIIATFRRARFLDFLYLTSRETSDPDNYPSQDQRTAAATACKDVRGIRNSACSDIQFVAGDVINGPLHSNDSLLICGAARFGRTVNDAIETSAAAPGYYTPSGCTGSPNFVSALRTGAGTVEPPDRVDQLEQSASVNYSLTGTNYLTFNGTQVTITPATATGLGTPVTRPLPANGLIYVGTGASGCGTTVPPAAMPYTGAGSEAYGCANVYVQGNYSKDVTIASAKDVIVRGNLTQTSGSNAVAGLIADRFVRVYHPVSSIADSNGNCSGSNSSGSLTNPVIEAAILARDHSFTVDNFRCGAALGTLTVTGGIAQKFRGAVGTGGNGSSSVSTGYLKNYTYDDRLTYRNPPFFLDPENATWRVLRSNEQVPAR